MSGDFFIDPERTRLSRRSLFGLAASSAVTAIVSQSVIGCKDAAAEDQAGACILTASLTEGPYFIDERLERSDIRSDPGTGAVSQGVSFNLAFNVSRVETSACTPLTGAYLDVWHCDSVGVYSDVSGAGTGRKFLRGYQVTDSTGMARFVTVYPGWYQGRAVHVHFKLRLFSGSMRTYEFTSQFFLNDVLTDTIHANSPYNTRGQRDTRNSNDGIFNSLSSAQKTALTLNPTLNGAAYDGVVNLGVRVG
jgi:protocatechuate 3,4-dioxygenase beta subunit